MITAIVRFKLRPGVDRERALAEIRDTVPIYRAQPALLRKQITLDVERGEGMSVYLWRDRASAETFYEMARPILAEQTGAEPEITLHDTVVVVDNEKGAVEWA